jgi:hypothetical protein
MAVEILIEYSPFEIASHILRERRNNVRETYLDGLQVNLDTAAKLTTFWDSVEDELGEVWREYGNFQNIQIGLPPHLEPKIALEQIIRPIQYPSLPKDEETLSTLPLIRTRIQDVYIEASKDPNSDARYYLRGTRFLRSKI